MNKSRRSIITVGVVSALAVLSSLGTAASAGNSQSSSGVERIDYVVRFNPGVDVASEVAAQRRLGVGVRATFQQVFPGAVMTLDTTQVEGLRRNPKVATIEADGPVAINDTQAGATWGLDRIDQRSLPLSGSFTWLGNGAGVTAYIIDTGILAGHVEFGGRVGSGYTAIADTNGTTDCNGHGTHVAGTVGGATYGVAKNVSLIPVRVLDCTGSGSMSGVIAGIDWMIAHHTAGVPAVANMSLGGGAYSTLDAAVQSAVNDGITMAVAAGNNNLDACNYSPARAAAAITVGATTSTDARASYSNYGTCLDIFAPGSSITSAWSTSTTATNTISGTSMATPHVTGVAAVMLSLDPTLSPTALTSAMTATATTGVVTSAGTGSPNRLLFLNSATTPPPTATAPSAPTGVSAVAGSRSASVSWTQGSIGGSALTSQTITIYQGTKAVGTVSVSATATSATISRLTAGVTYTFTVKATNAIGTSAESTKSNAVKVLK